jgi:hypothetical protein
MADNVAITAGAGTTVAADEVTDGTLGTVKVQFVKLMDGTLDGTSKALVGARGLAVDLAPTALSIAKAEDVASADADVGVPAMMIQKATPADTAGSDGDWTFLQGKNGALWTSQLGFFATCTTDITRPADTNAYVAGDNLSDSTSAPTSGGFTFTGAARKSGGSGVITDLLVMSSNAAGGMQGEVWIFDTSVTNINDNAAFAISDSEIKTVVAKIPFLTVADTNNALAHVQNLAAGFTCVGSANLRYLIKLKAPYTPASAEVITARIKCIQVD